MSLVNGIDQYGRDKEMYESMEEEYNRRSSDKKIWEKEDNDNDTSL
jgi:hypothetical protein